MKSKFFAFVLLATSASMFAAGPMTNADVVKMIEAKLSKKNIVAAIETAPTTAFEVAPAGLLALKAAGVDDDIIMKIQDAALKQPASKPTFVMTNEKVIEMVKDKKFRLRDKIVLKAIDNAPSRSFDVSAQGLIDLKLAAVSDAVITKIQELSTMKAAPEGKPEPLVAKATVPALQPKQASPEIVAKAEPAPVPAKPARTAKSWQSVQIRKTEPTGCTQIGDIHHNSADTFFSGSTATRDMYNGLKKKAEKAGANVVVPLAAPTQVGRGIGSSTQGDALFFYCPQ